MPSLGEALSLTPNEIHLDGQNSSGRAVVIGQSAASYSQASSGFVWSQARATQYAWHGKATNEPRQKPSAHFGRLTSPHPGSAKARRRARDPKARRQPSGGSRAGVPRPDSGGGAPRRRARGSRSGP